MAADRPAGPLDGIRIIEAGGIGPAPFCGMMLADMGAEVVVIDRPAAHRPDNPMAHDADPLRRSRRSIVVDLKQSAGIDLLLQLIDRADGVVEGFRPGVMERLGAGPEACLERNPRVVYGRMTGWGQSGPWALEAGHDINYLALSGTLSLIGRAEQPPVPPLNLVGDFGGGGMLLAFGMVCALLAAQRHGRGQVVDAAMVDGAALLATEIHGMRAHGTWNARRGGNLLDSGAHFYEVYECADGRHMAVGAIEPRFYALLLERLGLSSDGLPAQWDMASWPRAKARLADVFRTRSRDEWTQLLCGADTCATPVLSVEEAAEHAHNRAREVFIDVAGVRQPAPAPRFSATPAGAPQAPPSAGEHTDAVLTDLGLDDDEIAALRTAGVIA